MRTRLHKNSQPLRHTSAPAASTQRGLVDRRSSHGWTCLPARSISTFRTHRSYERQRRTTAYVRCFVLDGDPCGRLPRRSPPLSQDPMMDLISFLSSLHLIIRRLAGRSRLLSGRIGARFDRSGSPAVRQDRRILRSLSTPMRTGSSAPLRSPILQLVGRNLLVPESLPGLPKPLRERVSNLQG